eukprot:9251448-Karenia_brevis.AAC.1
MASCAPPMQGSPCTRTSMRRSSLRGTDRFMSFNSAFVQTVAPASAPQPSHTASIRDRGRRLSLIHISEPTRH